MYLLQVLLLFYTPTTVSALCNDTSWSFIAIGQYICEYIDRYIRGLERGTNRGNNDYIDNLEGALCCTAPPQWSNIEPLVVYASWTYDLDRTFAWVYCPAGYFLQGLYRSDDVTLNNIEGGRCTKPSSHPFYYGDCYQENIQTCFDNKGTCSCREGYFVTGLYKSSCNKLNCLDSLRCCAMAETPSVLDEPSKVKTRIMETSLWNMANLASLLGYSYCSGCNARNVGEDFYIDGNDWVANQNPMFFVNCNGYRSNERLRLAFGDWRFDVKDIKYGQSIVEQLHGDSLHSGIIYNKDDTPLTEQLDITETIEDTITHSSTSSWKSSRDLDVKLEFNIGIGPFITFSAGSSQTIHTSFEQSSSSTSEMKTLTSKTLSKHTSKTLAPLSAAKYTVTVNKVRTTIPYTAVIITRFSTELRGFLKWDGGYSSPNTNYHYLYRGTENRPTFNYRFGDNSTPFYTALKEESDSQSMPWFWNEMMKEHPQARNIINRLTEETQYEFLLSGKLEHVAGTNIDVVWEAVNLTRREVLDRTKTQTTILNFTHVLTSSPNDKPAKIEYPEVSLLPTEPFTIEVIPV